MNLSYFSEAVFHPKDEFINHNSMLGVGGDWKSMFKGIQENDLELVRF